jgi:hypothetical protein
MVQAEAGGGQTEGGNGYPPRRLPAPPGTLPPNVYLQKRPMRPVPAVEAQAPLERPIPAAL